MSLEPGTRVGVYDVTALIGRGGMGEVYRARDTRLQRDVAVKILPESVAFDDGRIARFEREGRALAALSHPNIAVIHGIEDLPSGAGEPARKALVMELVEGDTLEDRLRRGPLRTDDALAVAEQIAGALAAAHDKGIVHRDLKPANVKITPGGVVKVLDFGLARTLDGGSHDPATVTMMTRTGAVVGTPAYMAPEQAQGGPVDERVDVWAFGMLLYEMVTGRRPSHADAAADAAELASHPGWSRIPPDVRPLLRRCLQIDPHQRLRDIGDARFLIEAARAGGPAAPGSRRGPMLALAALALAAAAAALWALWFRSPSVEPGEPIRLTTMLPADAGVTRGPAIASSVALSPDGRTLVIAGTGKDGARLYARTLDRLEAAPIAGTERGSSPFFSPDGAWIGFFADGRLKRVPVDGGTAVDIVQLKYFPAGASWGGDNRIVFASGAESRLQSVHADGGAVEAVNTKATPAYRPVVLPNGTILFDSGGWVHALDRSTGRETRLVQGIAPHHAAGHLILGRGTTLFAAPIDLARLELTGPIVPAVEGVAPELASVGTAHYALSPGGTLAYVAAVDRHALVLVNPDGTERIVSEGAFLIENPHYSADGTRLVVAMTRRPGERADLWVHELDSGAASRLTFDGGRAPVWAPDGTTITYSHLGSARGIYSKRADGRGDAVRLLPMASFHWLVGWTPDRRTLAYGVMEGMTSSIMAAAGGRSRRVVGPGSTWGGRLSPDGKWLVYYSLDSGTFEIYVTPFPDGGSRWLIADGADPKWAPEGGEIYYRSGARLMAARIDLGSGVRVLSHRVVLEPFLPPTYDDYDIHRDGRTLAIVRPAGSTRSREVTMVLNWLTDVRRRTDAADAGPR